MARDRRPQELPGARFLKLGLYDFIPALSPDLAAPYHLADYVTQLERLDGGKVRACVACPPQVGKTTTVLHAIVWLLLRNPKLKIVYASHAQRFSDYQSRIIRELYLQAGGQIKDGANTVSDWSTEGGGGLYSTSWEGSLIGRRVDVLVCDDLTKDAKMADSPEQREHIQRWFDGVAMQRLWVDASVLVIGSRWHPDDLSGRLIAKGWQEIRLPAVRENEAGEEVSIWPDVKPLAFFDDLRLPSSPNYIGHHAWMAAYQGEPVPREGAVFGPAHEYTELPDGAKPVAIGFDMATSAKEHSDWSAIVILFEHMGLYYVHEVRRTRQVIGDVEESLRQVQRDYPGVQIVSYVGGQERAIYDLLFYRGIEVARMPARVSKWARSQRAAIAWKAGRILVRKGQTWTKAFSREVEYFTGNEDAHDDQVDALVSAYDYVALQAPVGWAGNGFRFGKAGGI